MRCLYCGGLAVKVVDTVPTDKSVLRRRKCQDCGNAFFTEELAYKVSTENGSYIKTNLNSIRNNRVIQLVEE
jgi:transcriptional regulator NrdR family protein